MKHIYFLLLACLSLNAFSQTPQGISYQGVLRNLDGSIISGANITITFRIHDSSPDGIVVYEENHATTTGSNGLVNLTVGAGTAVTGIFSQIAWGAGNKYLQVLMDNGSGEIDLGTQQMMSVPYALYAEKSNTTNISVSAVGDTLYLGNGNYILIPGISNSNAPVETGLGAYLLPGAIECVHETISASGCDGLTELEYQGYTYDLVEIAGQCWFKENLRATSFNDGTPISNGNLFSYNTYDWEYYKYYDNDSLNLNKFGVLYSAKCLPNDKTCPVGWHVPTRCDFFYLAYKQGTPLDDINNNRYNSDHELGESIYLPGKLLDQDTSYWEPFNTPYETFFYPSNSTGLSIKLGGEGTNYYNAEVGVGLGLGNYTRLWLFSRDAGIPQLRFIAQSITISPYASWYVESSNRNIYYNEVGSVVGVDNGSKLNEHYIRCIKD